MEPGWIDTRILAASSQGSVQSAGLDLLLKPGTQEFSMTAPDEPGEYVVVCSVICSEEHEGMFMMFVVTS